MQQVAIDILKVCVIELHSLGHVHTEIANKEQALTVAAVEEFGLNSH